MHLQIKLTPTYIVNHWKQQSITNGPFSMHSEIQWSKVHSEIQWSKVINYTTFVRTNHWFEASKHRLACGRRQKATSLYQLASNQYGLPKALASLMKYVIVRKLNHMPNSPPPPFFVRISTRTISIPCHTKWRPLFYLFNLLALTQSTRE